VASDPHMYTGWHCIVGVCDCWQWAAQLWANETRRDVDDKCGDKCEGQQWGCRGEKITSHHYASTNLSTFAVISREKLDLSIRWQGSRPRVQPSTPR